MRSSLTPTFHPCLMTTCLYVSLPHSSRYIVACVRAIQMQVRKPAEGNFPILDQSCGQLKLSPLHFQWLFQVYLKENWLEKLLELYEVETRGGCGYAEKNGISTYETSQTTFNSRGKLSPLRIISCGIQGHDEEWFQLFNKIVTESWVWWNGISRGV